MKSQGGRFGKGKGGEQVGQADSLWGERGGEERQSPSGRMFIDPKEHKIANKVSEK